MDEKKEKLKQRKKSYKKAKRKLFGAWKTVGIITLVFSILLSIGSVVAKTFDNSVAALVGGRFWNVINEDPNAIYFSSDYETAEQRLNAGKELCYQVEAEGAVLLTNNGILPLAANSRVSTLSTSSVDLVYGGTGSGNVDASKSDNLKTALEKSGFVVNPTLWDFYTNGEGKKYSRKSSAGESGALMGKFNIGEAPWSAYPQNVKDSFASYGDAVIVTISRIGGEGADLAFDYLKLDQNERDMLAAAAKMKADGKIKSIIMLINSSNPLQVDFLKNNEYSIDACLWIGGVGGNGINAVTDILVGKVNPSGSLVDTYCYDNFSAPAMKNAVPVSYGGYKEGEGVIPDYADSYLIYQEGIYVGYKYYETRYEDYVTVRDNVGDYHYSDEVAFPFGHGLSYTTFEYSDLAAGYNAETDEFEMYFLVTNVGKVAGKETVQVYAQAPYTEYDQKYGVEKPSVSLVGFTKTEILQPGETAEMAVYISRRELASFDTYGKGTYILEPGEYYLTLAKDSHDAVNNILASKGYEQSEGRMDAPGDPLQVHYWHEEKLDDTSYSTSANGTPIIKQLSLADPNLYEGTRGKTPKEKTVTWLSRSNWVGTFPSDQQLVMPLTDQLIKDLQQSRYDPADYGKMEMPTMGADNGLKLQQLIGLSYDHPLWNQLLDQLTFDEMVSMIGDSFHWRMPVESVHAPGSRDENGPQGLTVALFGSSLGVDTTAFTSEDVMAATFNRELIYEVGRLIGNDCLAADVSCLYGPGANIHRTPFGGRNFEYYSEDGFLSGKICAAEVLGLQEKGVDVVIKHFALNDSEQDRIGLGVWINEQAAREIYLKAFQAAFEESGANGVMTAYTRWGAVWSGGVKGLMTNILRREWGNNGMSITDNVITRMVTGADGVLAGVTTYDAMLWYITKELPKYKNDPVIVNAMREACHHNLYALANSSAMNGIGPKTTIDVKQLPVVTLLIVLTVLFWAVHIGSVVMWVRGKKKWKATSEYKNYMKLYNAVKEEKKKIKAEKKQKRQEKETVQELQAEAQQEVLATEPQVEPEDEPQADPQEKEE